MTRTQVSDFYFFFSATTVICKNAVHMVNDTEPDGFSALHIAAANDFAEVASILLDQVPY